MPAPQNRGAIPCWILNDDKITKKAKEKRVKAKTDDPMEEENANADVVAGNMAKNTDTSGTVMHTFHH